MTTNETLPVGRAFTYKFNPSFQTDGEAIDHFIVRRLEFDAILESIRATATQGGNRAVLITAPRGAGKTTLIRRVLAEVRTAPDLARTWHPVFLGEESYSVTTPGEFFLECLFHLHDQLQDPRWRARYDDAALSRDEDTLLKKCLSALHDFSLEHQKHLLLLVENIHMIFGEQMGAEAKALWKIIGDDDTFMVIASSVRLVEEDRYDYDPIIRDDKVIHLQPLNLAECQRLWEALTGQEVRQERIRPLQILTGGSPRLLRIMAEFAVTTSLQNLMENLNLLIDQNTEYFKSQLDSLPPTERKVFAALLDIWDPSTAKQVSESARVNVNIASAMLGRLADRGSVVKLPGRGRSITYFAAERLFNIYYLMRRRSHPSSRVRALVAFMTQYYGGNELIDTTAKLVAEACSLHPMRRQEYHTTFNAIIAQSSGEIRQRILSQTPDDFLSPIRDSAEFRLAIDVVDESQKHERVAARQDDRRLKGRRSHAAISRRANRRLSLPKSVRIALDDGDYKKAEILLRSEIASNEADGRLWLELAFVLRSNNSDREEVLKAARRAVSLLPENSTANALLGATLYHRSGDNEEAEKYLKAAIVIDPNSVLALSTLGDINHQRGEITEALDYYRRTWTNAQDLEFALCDLISIIDLHLSQHGEAERILRDALGRHPEWQRARYMLAENLAAQERLTNAEEILREGIERDSRSATFWADLAYFQYSRLKKYADSKSSFERSLQLDGTLSRTWIAYARVLQKIGSAAEEAIDAAKTATKLSPELINAWSVLGDTNLDVGKLDEAEEAFRKAISLDENSAFCWYRLGTFLQDVPGRLAEAESALRKAVSSSEKYPCAVPKELAALLIHKGVDEEAKGFLGQAVERNVKCYCSLTLLAGVAKRKGAMDEARDYFERALDVDKTGITAITGLSQLAVDHYSDLDLAEELVGRAMTSAPEDPRALFSRALLRRAQGNMKDCLADLGDALAVDPEFIEAKVLLALIGGHQGDAPTAISHLTDAMRWVGCRREFLSGIVDAAVLLAQRGYGTSVARAILDAEALEYLEPLHVAMLVLQGEAPIVAKEVQEVANDIVGRISKSPP